MRGIDEWMDMMIMIVMIARKRGMGKRKRGAPTIWGVVSGNMYKLRVARSMGGKCGG